MLARIRSFACTERPIPSDPRSWIVGRDRWVGGVEGQSESRQSFEVRSAKEFSGDRKFGNRIGPVVEVSPGQQEQRTGKFREKREERTSIV